jgi:hypothetical protein
MGSSRRVHCLSMAARMPASFGAGQEVSGGPLTTDLLRHAIAGR